MTHREKMIERAARDLWDKAEHDYWDHETDCRAFDVNDPDPEVAEMAQDWLATATEVADALLPQIHTEADFTALYRQGHLDTLLIDRDGDTWRLHEASLRVLHQHGPLTIVWQPS